MKGRGSLVSRQQANQIEGRQKYADPALALFGCSYSLILGLRPISNLLTILQYATY
jgi:hypothetical protein